MFPVKHIDSRLITAPYAPTLFVLIEHNCVLYFFQPPFCCHVGEIVATLLFHRLHRLSTLCFTCKYVHADCMFGINSYIWSVNRWQSCRFPGAKCVFQSEFLFFCFFFFQRPLLNIPQCANCACGIVSVLLDEPISKMTCKEAWERCLLSMHCFFSLLVADDT